MIVEDLRTDANENLTETYFRLGLAAPDSGVWHDEGFKACLGGFPHPICNFAITSSLNPWSARRLTALANARPEFRVYLLPEDSSAIDEETLRRAGFAPMYSLVSMWWDSRRSAPPITPRLQMVEALDRRSRDRAAGFMTDVFFWNHSRLFRDRVRYVTTEASDLRLFISAERAKAVAGAMISRTPGAIGIYNLGVSPKRRNNGLGTELVRWCQELGRQEGLSVTLQCDSSLAGWYSSLGFSSIGRLKAFSLPKTGDPDIMEAGSVPL